MNPTLTNRQIIDLLKTIPNNNILYSFIKKIESLIDNNSNSDTVLNVINKTYNIILIIIKTFNKETSVRLDDDYNDTKKLKTFYDKYVGYIDVVKKYRNNNLVHNLIDLEIVLYNKNIRNKLNSNDKITILRNVYNFTINFGSVFNEQIESDQLSSISNNEDEITYCYCNRPYNEEDMIACDGPNCEIEWFHLACINLKEVPRNTWYCNECAKNTDTALSEKLKKPIKRPKIFAETRGRKKKIETRGRKKDSKNKPKKIV